MVEKLLVDSFGRRIDYLRLSITDRCDLNCIYCLPKKRISLLNHSDILTFEEIKRLLGILSNSGIKKIRITGGEPFLRHDALDLIGSIRGIPGIEKLVITTNGLRLLELTGKLKKISIDGLNVSLDSLDSGKYKLITSHDGFEQVLNGIKKAIEDKIENIKINVVVMFGINDDEIPEFVKLAKEIPIEVRFIEYMPLVHMNTAIKFIPRDKIMSLIPYKMKLLPRDNGSTASCYNISGFSGKIGIIAPITEKFCSNCGKMRISADGKLRVCLMDEQFVDLKLLLRQGLSDEDIFYHIENAISRKNKSYTLDEHNMGNITMSSIGG
jgi:GTP 3',8-cyclase